VFEDSRHTSFPACRGWPVRPKVRRMLKRIVILYAVLGPVAGATLYVTMSMLAAVLEIRPDIFIPAQFIGATLAAQIDLLTWQIAVSAPVTLMPAVLTGWMTARRIIRDGDCPWWLSCGYGGVFSGGLGFIGLGLGHLLMPDLSSIPPVGGGSALIALIGFLGTLPCWWLGPYALRRAAYTNQAVRIHPPSAPASSPR
jgi:hypothetical protein